MSVTSGCWNVSLWVSHASKLQVSVGMCLALRVLGYRPSWLYLPICIWVTGHSVRASGDLGVCVCYLHGGVSFLFSVVCPPPFYPSLCPSFPEAPLLRTLLGSVCQCLYMAASQAKCVTALAEMAQRGLSLCASS